MCLCLWLLQLALCKYKHASKCNDCIKDNQCTTQSKCHRGPTTSKTYRGRYHSTFCNILRHLSPSWQIPCRICWHSPCKIVSLQVFHSWQLHRIRFLQSTSPFSYHWLNLLNTAHCESHIESISCLKNWDKEFSFPYEQNQQLCYSLTKFLQQTNK